jgi:hypothetical protein
MIAAAEHLSHHVSKKAACEAFSVPRATFYRHQCRKTRLVDTVKERPAPPLALKPDERQRVIDILLSRMPDLFANSFSVGITKSTVIQALA